MQLNEVCRHSHRSVCRINLCRGLRFPQRHLIRRQVTFLAAPHQLQVTVLCAAIWADQSPRSSANTRSLHTFTLTSLDRQTADTAESFPFDVISLNTSEKTHGHRQQHCERGRCLGRVVAEVISTDLCELTKWQWVHSAEDRRLERWHSEAWNKCLHVAGQFERRGRCGLT